MTEITLVGPDGDEVDVQFDEQTRLPIGMSVSKDSPVPKLYAVSFNPAEFIEIHWTPGTDSCIMHPDNPGNALKWLRTQAGYQAISDEEDWINGKCE